MYNGNEHNKKLAQVLTFLTYSESAQFELQPETDYPNISLVDFLNPSRKCQEGTLNQATTNSFNFFSN
jgi:hypothetical protein